MKNLLAPALLLCFSFAAPAQDLPSARPAEVGMSADKLARVGPVVQKLIDDKKLAGAVTIVARRGKVVHFEARGMRNIAGKKAMEKDTIFRIYSMTKAVVSVAAMILVEQGKLELDVPASKYIPALGKMKFKGKIPEREMTLRDLLRHTAGFPNNVSTDRALRQAGHPSLADSTLEEMMNRLDVVPLKYPPGKGWHYSFAADVVARLVEIGSDQTVDRALAELVFKPLGMVDTAFHCPKEKRDRFVVVYGQGLKPTVGPQPGTTGPFTFENPPKFLSGGGGLVSTAGDYMRFCLMLSGKGELDGKRLLKAETVEAMTRNQIPQGVGEITRRPQGRGFGLGFAVRTRKIDGDPSPLGEYEWLGGAGTEFFLSPRDELVVITLSQQMPMLSLKQAVRPLVYDALADRKTSQRSRIDEQPTATASKEQGGRDLERSRYLLLDARIIETKTNAKLTPGTVKKHPKNPLFVENKPWEPRYDNMYPNVIYDEEEKLYKCWYCPFIVDERTSATPLAKRDPASTHYMSKKPNRREEGLLYATSKDGIHWEKPELGIVEFQGSSKNNIACRGLSGAGVIKDTRDPKPERRYKAFYCSDSGYKMRYSADGLRWSSEVALPGVGQSDCHANMIWSPALQKYVGIVRHYDGSVPVVGHRKIARTESADAVKWTPSTTIIEGTPTNQLHDMTIFRDGGVYLGLVGCMKYPSSESREGVRQQVELAWSPDSYTWHRISPGTPLIGPTAAKDEAYGKTPYDWGNTFAAQPVFRDGEIRIYYGASDWYFFDWRKGGLALATLRPDGWAGYEPIERDRPATITTTPLRYLGGALRLSADVMPGGSIRLTALNGRNEELAVAETIAQTVTDGKIEWIKEFSGKSLIGQRVRLEMVLRRAKVYSFSFEN